jgi:hypothetical protein|tara:strand:- start:5350 stop:5850 length:501 start_codon:yes stop_codon:yes gene_type:complete
MRLMKAQSTNLRSIAGTGMKYDINGINRMGGETGIVVPLGDTAARPTFPEAGMMRYNTDVDAFEIYADGAWGEVRKKEPGNIVQQNLGNGDASETVFGPLVNGDINFPTPAAARNILVFIENVFQIATTNYTIVQNPAGKAAGWYVSFGSAPDTGKPITVLHNFDK